MLSKANLKGILAIKQIAGIEVCFQDSSQYKISGLVLNRSSKGLNIEKTFEDLNNIAALNEELPAGIPVSLALTGRGIIHKPVEFSNDIGKKDLMSLVLPNASLDDFQLQKFANDNSNALSVIRSESLIQVIDELKENGFLVLAASLGPFAIEAIAGLLVSDDKSSDVVAGGQLIQVTGSGIRSWEESTTESEDKDMLVGNERLNSSLVLSFAAAFAGLYPALFSGIEELDVLNDNRSEVSNKMAFKKLGWAVLGLFLVVLMTNFFLLQDISKANAELDASLSIHKQSLQKLNELKEETKGLEQLVQSKGLGQTSLNAYYSDQLAALMPSDLSLSQLRFATVIEGDRNELPWSFDSKSIRVKGTSNKSAKLNEWIEAISGLDWVTDVGIQSYEQSNAKTDAKFHLEIKIKWFVK